MTEAEYGSIYRSVVTAAQNAAAVVHAISHASVADRFASELRSSIAVMEESLAADPSRAAASAMLLESAAGILGELSKSIATQNGVISAVDVYFRTGNDAELRERYAAFAEHRAKMASAARAFASK